MLFVSLFYKSIGLLKQFSVCDIDGVSANKVLFSEVIHNLEVAWEFIVFDFRALSYVWWRFFFFKVCLTCEL